MSAFNRWPVLITTRQARTLSTAFSPFFSFLVATLPPPKKKNKQTKHNPFLNVAKYYKQIACWAFQFWCRFGNSLQADFHRQKSHRYSRGLVSSGTMSKMGKLGHTHTRTCSLCLCLSLTHTHTLIYIYLVCVSVCVKKIMKFKDHVCKRDSEKERERERLERKKLCVCVYKRERDLNKKCVCERE